MAADASMQNDKELRVVTVPVSPEVSQLLNLYFSEVRVIQAPITNPRGACVEALRDQMVARAFSFRGDARNCMHVGGFLDQHCLYGRLPHLETPSLTTGLMTAKQRRLDSLYALGLRRPAFEAERDYSGLNWGFLDEALRLSYGMHECVPGVCTLSVDFIFFDINMIPISQEQAALVMMQHACVVAQGIFMVHGAFADEGLQPLEGFETYSVLINGEVHYVTAEGPVEFPAASLLVLQQWARRKVFYIGERMFQVELLERVGPFQRFSLTDVGALGDVQGEVWHAEWDAGGENSYVLNMSVLRGGWLDPSRASSYVSRRVLVDRRVLDEAVLHAFSADKTNLTRGVVRAKIMSSFSRAVIKGTTVVVREMPSVFVIDAMTSYVYWYVYAMRFSVTQTFSKALGPLKDAIGAVGTGALSRVMGAVGLVFSRSLDSLHKIVGIPALRRFLVRTLSRVGALPRAILSTPSVVTLYRDLLERTDMSALLLRCARVLVGAPGGVLASLYERVYLGRPLGGYAFGEAQAYANVVLADVDEADAGLLRVPKANTALGARVISKIQSRVEAGPDLVPGFGHYERLDTIAEALAPGVERRAQIDDPDFVNTLTSAYQRLMPDVANTDFSYETDQIHSRTVSDVLDVAYYRDVTDEDVPRSRALFYSLLPGPNRPAATLSSRLFRYAFRKRNADPATLKVPMDDGAFSAFAVRAWKEKLCRPDIEEHLLFLRNQPVHAGFPHFFAWVQRTDEKKLLALDVLMDELEDMFDSVPVEEFVAMFKGDVKPTMSNAAASALQKFQTLVYHDDRRVAAAWGPIISDLAARYESCLRPECMVAFRGDSIRQEQHFTKFWPYGKVGVSYTSTDISECDKSQGRRHQKVEMAIYAEMGMTDAQILAWAEGHTVTFLRLLSMCIKATVGYQRKSGEVDTFYGNTIMAHINQAVCFPPPICSIVGGDDDQSVHFSELLRSDDIPALAANAMNFPLKYIVYHGSVSEAVVYAFSAFFVVDSVGRSVWRIPDPIKAIESLSKPLTVDRAKFAERWQSFHEKCALWDRSFPEALFEKEVRTAYRNGELPVMEIVRALVSAGRSELRFRSLWRDIAQSENYHGLVK